jgi:phosphonate transport system substrate-binding protein
VRADLRVLYETPGAASHPLCAHPRVPSDARAALIESLLALAREPEGRALLEPVFPDLPVRADLARDYLPLEKLKLDKYAVRPSA